jgi:hypothetical protein
MQKILSFLLSIFMSVASFFGLVKPAATTTTPTTVDLSLGTVQVYDYGENKLYAYVSGDALGDTCYAVESSEGLVLIESTAVTANNEAWNAYLQSLNKPIVGSLMAFHPNGAATYGDAQIYATQNALTNWGEGGSIRGLTDGFVAAFGDSIASDLPSSAKIVNFGDTVTIGGLDFVIRNEGDDAYGIEIPAINCVYIHMMGSNCHNILTSVEHIDAFISELESFNYNLVLTGHNAPEDSSAVKTKINYLKKVRELATTCTDAASFTKAMNEAFPDYEGASYLDMTAGYLF